VHRLQLEDKSNEVIQMIKQKKKIYYQEKFLNVNAKEIHRLIDSLCDSSAKRLLPADIPDSQLCHDFMKFFVLKIERIRADIALKNVRYPLEGGPVPLQYGALQVFKLQRNDDVRKLIKSSATKSCDLDSIPVALLKNDVVLQAALPLITKIINTSLTSGDVPLVFKAAIVVPGLKKPSLDANDLKNYRPISNISFPAKILEKVVAAQLVEHMTKNGLFDPYQSAYQKRMSCETALVKIKDDVDRMLDNGEAVLIVLLDLSAAFDTVEHSVLLQRLGDIGVTGLALSWFSSYLQGRKQQIRINDALSPSFDLVVGVPQGSVLGPLLFLIYILPIKNIIDRYGIFRHGYADDTQLYCPLPVSDAGALLEQVAKMERCLDEIRLWMYANGLKINESKTEVLVASRKAHEKKMAEVRVRIGNAVIVPKTVVKNLGALIDSGMTMKSQVADTTRRASFRLRCIARIRPYLSNDACARAIHTSVMSRLDFHNALLLGAPTTLTRRLQLIQNSAARLLTRTPSREHITPVLAQLHWLPVRTRIDFKAVCMVHIAMHQTSPEYISAMCTMNASGPISTRSHGDQRLTVPRPKSSYGERAFSFAAIRVWNELPLTMRNIPDLTAFKKALKTHFYRKTFVS
jgi:hypothetical protein